MCPLEKLMQEINKTLASKKSMTKHDLDQLADSIRPNQIVLLPTPENAHLGGKIYDNQCSSM